MTCSSSPRLASTAASQQAHALLAFQQCRCFALASSCLVLPCCEPRFCLPTFLFLLSPCPKNAPCKYLSCFSLIILFPPAVIRLEHLREPPLWSMSLPWVRGGQCLCKKPSPFLFQKALGKTSMIFPLLLHALVFPGSLQTTRTPTSLVCGYWPGLLVPVPCHQLISPAQSSSAGHALLSAGTSAHRPLSLFAGPVLW